MNQKVDSVKIIIKDEIATVREYNENLMEIGKYEVPAGNVMLTIGLYIDVTSKITIINKK